MKKQVPVLAVCAIAAVSVAIGASAVGVVTTVQSELRPDFTIVIDGKEQTFKNAQGEVVDPMLYNGTTYLPIRAIGNIMGKTVYWYEDEKRIELKDSKTTVTDADVIVSGDAGSSGSGGGQISTGQQPAEGEITLEQAKAIALQEAGFDASEVQFGKTELDRDDGVRQYEIEFWKDGVEYSADIRASDGFIISWDVDREWD